MVGNCQAESIRVVIDSPQIPMIRTPPVHELTAADTRLLHELLPRASFLVTQPVRDDYHGLPLGTRQLRESLRIGAKSLTITPIRFTGLYPFQARIHVPGVESVPPLVAYHDVRNLAAAAGISVAQELAHPVTHTIAADSLAELRRREATTDVSVSDLFDRPVFSQLRTVNHPDNAIFLSVGERIITKLGVDAAPTEWYAQHPQFVAGAVDRLRPLLQRWGVSER